MCQATVYLNGEEVMRDVLRVKLLPDQQVRLFTFFEAPRDLPAIVREIDLIKHRVLLESPPARSEEQLSRGEA
jgi:predicted RNA-binding protein